MKFIIHRASQPYINPEPRPCCEAFHEGRPNEWFINIKDLDELIRYIDLHKQIIIQSNPIYILTIYDDDVTYYDD